eukprot:365452-Chlamydomonas_euryale.AAC.22
MPSRLSPYQHSAQAPACSPRAAQCCRALFIHPIRLLLCTQAVLFTLSPHYCFATGANAVAASAPPPPGVPPLPPPFGPGPGRGAFEWVVSGRPIAAMVLQAVVYMSLVMLADSGVPRALWARARFHIAEMLPRLSSRAPGNGGGNGGSAADGDPGGGGLSNAPGGGGGGGLGDDGGDEDVDITAERLAVQAGARDGCRVLLRGVRKSYWPHGAFAAPVRAVRGLWLGVRPGECFGLLGVNGAGKTTTFKLITAEEAPDGTAAAGAPQHLHHQHHGDGGGDAGGGGGGGGGGDVLLAGLSVVTQRDAARALLGYCPQFEGLPAALTGREVVTLYARCADGVLTGHCRGADGTLTGS